MKELSVYRVHSVLTWPEGHVFKTRGGDRTAGANHNVTTWDLVLAVDCEQAMKAIHVKYTSEGANVKRIYSLNHIGDITLDATATPL